jgi:hypothetical protein
MTNIYDQHKAAFSNVSAFVVLKDGDRVATVAIKFPKDGAGRLYAYVHWLGMPMVRGFASGGGYDKRTAACSAAAYQINLNELPAPPVGQDCRAFTAALRKDSGYDWTRQLEDAGFTVVQAV